MSDTQPEWADPAEMNATYALLYNTLEFNARPFLPIQMDESIWRLVYAPPARDRRRCWRELGSLSYKPQRRVEGTRSQPRTDALAVPRRNVHRPTGRSFEMQQDDGYLCGMHSMNNVANAVLLTPPDHQSAIEAVRPLVSRLASIEELTLAALREGVFFVPLKLVAASDLNPLDPAERFPADKMCLRMVERARGMVVYQPSPQPGGDGHFVSLVYTEPPPSSSSSSASSDNDDYRWLVYSTGAVVSYGATAAAALDRYMLRVLGSGVSAPEKSREERRRMLQQENISPQRFIGLLPVSLRQLREDALVRLDLSNGSTSSQSAIDEDTLLDIIMQRTLLRRALSETRVTNGSDITLPEPVSPNAIDDLNWFLTQNMYADDATDELRTHFDGREFVNVGSFYMHRHMLDVELNMLVEKLLVRLLAELEAGWSAEPIAMRSRGRTAPLDVRQRYAKMRTSLAKMRGRIRDADGCLGLLLMHIDDSEPASFDKALRVLSNRRWLRYLALTVAASALIAELDRVMESGEYPLRDEARKVLVLFATTAYSTMQGSGIKLSSTPSFTALYRAMQQRGRDELLPLASLPDRIDRVVRTSPLTTQSPFAKLYTEGNYEWFLWLLYAVRDAELPGADTLPDFSRLEITKPAPPNAANVLYDNQGGQYDQLADFAILLRRTLFRAPEPRADFDTLARTYAEQAVNRETSLALAQLFKRNGADFVRVALERGYLTSAPEAALWINFLAFDARFASPDQQVWLAAKNDVAAHDLNDALGPRFLERAAQAGFANLRRRVAGILHFQPDRRAPITNNTTRLPLPRVPGAWYTTRPRTGKETQLCVEPLARLPLDRAAAARVVRTKAQPSDDESFTTVTSKRARKEQQQQPRAAPAHQYLSSPHTLD